MGADIVAVTNSSDRYALYGPLICLFNSEWISELPSLQMFCSIY